MGGNGIKDFEIIQLENSAKWDLYYQSYQAGSRLPGNRYPNEHYVRFLMHWKRRGPWPQDRKPVVVELGFGPAVNLLAAAELGCLVRGFEVSQDAVKRARLAIADAGKESTISVDCFNGPVIPMPDQSCDAVVGLQSVYYNLDQEAFAAECSRVLRPGGVVLFSFFTPNHVYMHHMKGAPGGVVQFAEDHPNPRLVGLELYLYRDEQEMTATYEKFFDVVVGLEEYDLVPTYQSWWYLMGRKRDGEQSESFQFPVSVPNVFTPISCQETGDRESNELLAENIALWEAYAQSRPVKQPHAVQRYPDEQVVRRLATWKRRREADYLKFYMGKEDATAQVDGLAALEINFQNPVHQIAMRAFGYKAHGVSYAPTTLQNGLDSLNALGLNQDVELSAWDGHVLPYADSSMDIIVAPKASYYQPNQKEFAAECMRTLKPGGELFLYYLAPEHGYAAHLEHVSGCIYRFTPDHPNPLLVGLNIFMALGHELASLWSKYLDVEIKHWRHSMHPNYWAFNVITGRKNFNA